MSEPIDASLAEANAMIEVADNLLHQARFLRANARRDAFKAQAAAAWEIKLQQELSVLREAAKTEPVGR